MHWDSCLKKRTTSVLVPAHSSARERNVWSFPVRLLSVLAAAIQALGKGNCRGDTARTRGSLSCSAGKAGAPLFGRGPYSAAGQRGGWRGRARADGWYAWRRAPRQVERPARTPGPPASPTRSAALWGPDGRSVLPLC